MLRCRVLLCTTEDQTRGYHLVSGERDPGRFESNTNFSSISTSTSPQLLDLTPLLQLKFADSFTDNFAGRLTSSCLADSHRLCRLQNAAQEQLVSNASMLPFGYVSAPVALTSVLVQAALAPSSAEPPHDQPSQLGAYTISVACPTLYFQPSRYRYQSTQVSLVSWLYQLPNLAVHLCPKLWPTPHLL